MVSRDLQTAADSLANVTADVDIVSVLTGAAGLGSGLMAAEYAGSQFSNFTSDQSEPVQFGADVLGRGTASAAMLALRRFAPGGPFASVLLMMGAFGAASSAVLRVVEYFVGAADDLMDDTTGSGSNSGSVKRKSKRRARSRTRNKSRSRSSSSGSSNSRTSKATVKNSAPQGDDEDAPTAASSWL